MANKGMLTILIRAISLFGTPFFYVPATAYLFRINAHFAITLAVILASNELICGCIKLLYPKERPIPMPRNTLFQKYLAGSFPSVHTSRITALFIPTALFYSNWASALAAMAIIALVGYSRIYLKKHYLTDVIGGFLIGAAMGILGFGIQNYLNIY